MDVSWGGAVRLPRPLNTGTEVLDSYPTNSAPNEGCTLPSACNYDPEPKRTMDPVSSMTRVACAVAMERAAPGARMRLPATTM